MIFAKWGAKLTLVEPNPNSWEYILTYFKKFNLNSNLVSLEKVDLENFKPTRKFSFVVAEGFIYTVRPESLWIDLFKQITEEGGFFLISYCEFFGALIELVLKLIYARAKSVIGADSNDIAWKLFGTKWNSIAHTRSFESWVMDVLENPFVRLNYFFNAEHLCKKLCESDFSLYSAWPNYIDNLDIYWHKNELSIDEKLEKNCDFIRRSHLSFVFARKLFLFSDAGQLLDTVDGLLKELLSLIDESIELFNPDILRQCQNLLARLKQLIISQPLFVDSSLDKEQALCLLASLDTILGMIIREDIDNLISFCNLDLSFIKFWGQPHHFAVFRKN